MYHSPRLYTIVPTSTCERLEAPIRSSKHAARVVEIVKSRSSVIQTSRLTREFGLQDTYMNKVMSIKKPTSSQTSSVKPANNSEASIGQPCRSPPAPGRAADTWRVQSRRSDIHHNAFVESAGHMKTKYSRKGQAGQEIGSSDGGARRKGVSATQKSPQPTAAPHSAARAPRTASPPRPARQTMASQKVILKSPLIQLGPLVTL